MQIFLVTATFSDGAGHSARARGSIEREAEPSAAEIASMYEEVARQELISRGFPANGPLKLSYHSVVKLPPLPRPAANDTRELKHWKITVDMVCDDIKYADVTDGVFAWAEEPAGAVLEQMTYYLIASSIAGRGDDPGNADYSRVRSRSVVLTDAPAINL
jgi:hypothetical protein